MEEEYKAPHLTEAETEERAKKAVRATSKATRVWKGHNFSYGANNIWYMDSDNAAVNFCAEGVTWDFPPGPNRSVTFPAGQCGPLGQYRYAQVTWG